MKKFLHVAALAICTLIATVNANAQVITADRAQEIANSFFSSGMQKSAAVRSTAAASLKKSADSRILSNGSSNEAPTFHILTPASGEGFVIVSGEEIENPIIGYSFEGTIDTNNLPDGFVDYITDIDAQVRALREYNAENPQKAAAARSAMQKTNYNATTMGEQVVLLETAKWGQDTPFNAQCWTTAAHTQQALTGCVPTAFAIIMRYHEWPIVGTGAIQDCQDEELPYTYYDNRTYDYSKMPLVYDGNWSTEQINEVAKLMSHLGHAFGVSYGTGSTSVTMGNSLTTATKTYFNYQDCSISNQYNNGSLADFTEWKNNLKNSLDNNCPVPYGANNIGSGTVDARHMFVVDGYTDDDYFHFNFGWNGGSNGWYKLDAITVGYSWSDDANGYTSKHQAFFNLTPNKTQYPVTATVEPENAGTVTVNPAEQIEGGIVTLAATANTGYTFSNWTKGGEVVSTNKSCTVKVASSDNDYVANFLTVGNTTVNVSVEYNSSYGTVTGTSGTVANGTTLTPRLNEEVTLTATPLDGYVFNGWTVTKGTESTNYSGTSLTFVATGEMSVQANFSTAIATYNISEATGTLENTTSSRYTTWSSSEVSGLYLTASYNSNAVEAISFNSGQVKLISAIYEEKTSTYKNPITYTLSAPDGYVITAYSMTYKSSSSNFAMTVANAQMTQTLANSNEVLTLSATGLSAQNTEFTVNGANTNYAIQVQEFTVTLQSEGGATPPSTQYTINVTAGEGGTATVNGNSSATVTEGATVTLTATPNSGYEFVNWTKGGIEVSTNATYSFTANASASYVANFQATAQTTFAVTTTANPVAGGTATFAEGTGQATSSATVASGTGVTLYAVANDGYSFVNWTKGGMEVSTNATQNVTITEASDYVANFEEEATATEYPTPTGNTYTNNYLTSITTTGGDTNIDYSANAHPGQSLVVVPGKVQLEKGESFTMNLVAYSLGEGSSSVAREDMRYCHASLFTDFDQDFTFEASPVQTWGVTGPSGTNPYAGGNSNVYGNYDLVMNITHTITVPDDAPTGESHVRMIYTNAWTGWPTNGTAELNKGIVYDIVVEVVEASNEQTLNVTYSGATWNNEESSWWVSVVTNTTPAVTVKTTDGTPKIGYSTFNDVRHPYLLDGNSFTISVPANCKITGYSLGYKAHNLVSKSVTYTNGKQSTGTITIAQSNEENTLTVTGLDNNEISISVEDQSSQAGFIIKSLEITYVENEFEPAMFKAEIEGWRDNNPNTHLGTITIGGTAMKLTPAHQTASELTMPVVEGTALEFTRKYRGFEFNGFYIGSTELGTNPTLTAENVAAIDENNPLIAKFTATDDATLFYDDDEFSYRIPAIAKTGNGMLVAVSDYRHNLDDIGRDNHGTGTKRVDLVMRTSTDNGATWSETKTIAAGDNNMVGSYQRAYGDAAIAAVGQNIVVMAAAGDVVYTAGTTSSPNKMARIYSTDNGATWAIEEMTTKMYSQSTSLIPSGGSAFFGSGKLAVDPNFNDTGNARIYGALLVRIGTDNYNNFGVFSDDLGATWKILGGDNTNPVAKGDEPKVEILPNGQILLSARRGGGRVFRVFTYGNDKANGAGSWGDEAVNGCDNGGSNATNGEIICLDAKRLNGKPTKILLQSQPKGGSGQYDRKDVTIWYKEVSADETYTSATIASDWTMGKQVSTQSSAYSTMCLQANGEIALFFEEAPCYGNDYTKGYSMVYVPLTIEEITNDNFLNPNADVEYVPTEFSIVLTDAQDNEYRETLDYIPGDVAAVESYLTTTYPFITLGTTGAIADNTYTNTVTLPFKVSNANTTVWHNIYWPSNTRENDYPVYLSASSKDDTYVPKVTGSYAYGNHPTYNTLDGNEKISWAIYNVNNGFEFIFKNKVTDKYIQVTNVATGNAQNVVYVENAEDATAFTIFNKPAGNDYYTTAQYALAAKVGETTGYLCSTSATGYNYATHYFNSNDNGYGHQGAWIEFVEAPDYQGIYEKLLADINNFGAGDGKYTENDAISNIDIDDLASMPLNSLNTKAEEVQNVKDSYTEITLTVPAVNDIVPGSVKILDEFVSHKFVPKGNVTIQAIPDAGYRFVNWTRPAAQASAAARTAEARNSDVVSTDNPYTVTVSEALSLEANFEQIVVNATLTDAEGNTYEVQVSGFTAEITKDAVAEKLREAYPYITLGTTGQDGNVTDFGELTIDGTAYTYTNMVELPFRVTNTTYLWHNIYYPSNSGNNPNYIAALNEDEIVDMAASAEYAYGDNPTYNTKAGNPKISWAIYNVNNNFEFIFKNAFTQKYIKVESVDTGNAQNVTFVEIAEEATRFTLLKDADSYNGDYALVAKVDDATGYLCATSSNRNYVTHFDHTNHQGAWVKFVEAPDYYSIIRDQGIILGIRFGAGDGKCIITDEISVINNDIANNSDNITFNTLNAYGSTMEEAMNNWPAVGLTINPAEGGTTNINGEENVVHKYVPNGYALPLAAVPAEGYHFVNWTGTDYESTDAATTITMSGNKGDVIEFTANFAINIYNINVTAGEGGSAMIGTETSTTVEHGSEITLTAVANDGYRFVNWTLGGNVVSTDATYSFTANASAEYVANFEPEVQDGLTTGYYHIVSRVTTSHEYLYNNALRTNNSKEFTLQSDSKITTNNGIWYITVNSNQLGVKNGDGNALVTGAAYRGNATTHNTLNIEKTTDVAGVTYYSFVEGINCTNRTQYNFTLEYNNPVQATDNNYVTTWAGNPDAQANQWRLERVDTDGKNIYDVVVECTEQDVYVVYGSGTNEEYAFNGGFFITDATITVQQLTAKKNNADAEGVTVLVEGNTIRVVDTEYVEITVSTTPPEGGSVTINGEAVSTLQVVKSSNVTVVATPVSGYHFVNWTDAGNAVSTDATYTFTASEITSLVANFEADVVYHTITVSTFYDNNGGTVKVGNEDATSVNVADGESVRMLATVNEGYEFMGWLKDGVIVKNAIGGGLDFEVQGPDYTLYEIKASAEYVAVFSKITDYTNLEDGKAYRIRAVSESCATRYIYREGTVLKWTNDGSNFDDNSIFVVQKNGNSINLISAIGYHGWKASNILGNDEQYNHYAAIKVTYGTKDDTRSLYLESGTSSGIYTTRPDNVFAFVDTPSKSSLPITDADNSTTNFLFEEVDTYAFQVSVADGSNAKLGTINLPFATTIPEGVTAYSVDYSEDEYVYMAELELTDKVLPANTPVLVEAEAAGKFGFKPAPASGDTYDTGFAGTLEAEDIPGTTNAYILSYKGVGTHIMLYKLSSTSRKINANKAYYIDETGKASSLRFVFGETTDIDDVEREDVEDTIYDLKGRKLSEITEPGFYIVNGKKIFVK